MLLRKYIKIFSITFKESMAYRFDTFTGALISFVKIYLAFILWTAIFDGKTIIGGYTFSMMLTYYIVMIFLERMGKSEVIIWETAEEVRAGTFTKYITRPVKHFYYALFRSLSKGAFNGVIDLMAFTVWILIFRNDFVLPTNPLTYLNTVAFAALGLITTMQVHYLIALISFKTVSIAGPYFLVKNFMDFAAGGFVPLMLLPLGLQHFLSYTPFYYTLYYPVSIFLEQEVSGLLKAVIVIGIWNILLYCFRLWYYKKMIRLYEGVGA